MGRDLKPINNLLSSGKQKEMRTSDQARNIFSLWRRTNAWIVSFSTLYDNQLTLSTQLIILNDPVILFHRRSSKVSLETCPLYSSKSDQVRILERRCSTWGTTITKVSGGLIDVKLSKKSLCNTPFERLSCSWNATDHRYSATLINVLASNHTTSVSYVYRKKSF